MPSNFQQALDLVRRRGALLNARSEALLRSSLVNYVGTLGEDITRQAVSEVADGIRSILSPQQEARPGQEQTVTVGDTPASVRGRVAELLKQYEDPVSVMEALNLDFKLDVATRVSRGAGRFVVDQTDVDEYPAWELHRIYDRDVPRGFKRLKGGLIPVPEDDWPHRWESAAEDSGDEDALRVFKQTGRMIALKSSGIWQALGDGAGGYDDTLGNPFAPFAFNSGFGTDGVPRNECIELGLLDADEEPDGSDFDFGSLFNLKEAA